MGAGSQNFDLDNQQLTISSNSLTISKGNSVLLWGTSGNSFFSFPALASAPATPSTGFSLYANSSNALSWKGSNGFLRVFDGTTNTADRTYTLPNASGTFSLLGSTQSYSGVNTFTIDTYLATSSGSVGIGTASPSTKLEVIDTTGVTFRHSNVANTAGGCRIFGGAYNGNKLTGMFLNTSSSANELNFGGGTALGQNPTLIRFYTNTSVGTVGAGTEVFTILGTGNVGVGSTNPQTKLHVYSTDANMLRLERNGVGIGNVTMSSLMSNSTADMLFDAGTNSGGFLFRAKNSSGTSISALGIDRNGKVGIGITAPTELLDINAPSDGGIILGVGNAIKGISSTFVGKTQLLYWSGNDVIFGRTATSETGGVSNFYFRTGDVNSTKMMLNSTGSLGIGSTSPTSKLHVVGLPTYTDNTAALAGGLTAGAFYRTSLGILMVTY
jgi:hypothetical protein